jgi:hypothetical protein
MKEECGNCKFWKRWTFITEGYLAQYPENKEKGDCHKNAPAVVGTSEEGYACWPDTNSFDWCGEWKEKPTSKG